MVHDFAKIRPEPLIERRPAETPPAWLLLFTGLICGITIGVFACFMLYLSGNIPPLHAVAVNTLPSAADTPLDSQSNSTEETTTPQERLRLEFYEELPNYEVLVDSNPVKISEEELAVTSANLEIPIMLQTNAFGNRSNADRERARLQALGLESVVKEEELPGRTLFLVQAGPFNNSVLLARAESVLQKNNIASRRLTLKAPL